MTAIVLIVIVAVLNAIGIIDTGISEEAEVSTTDGLIQAVIVVAYYVVLTVAFGGTLGKMALGMRVVDRDGNRAGLGPVLIREVIARALGTILAAILGSFIGGFVGAAVGVIIIIMILFDERRQGLHDKIGGTFVVRAR